MRSIHSALLGTASLTSLTAPVLSKKPDSFGSTNSTFQRSNLMLKNSIPKTTAIAIAISLGATQAPADDSPSFMFVQTSDTIVVDPEAKTLRMVDISPHTLYFSDRPDRLAGHITLDAYLREWTDIPDDFNDDPPNATLSVYEPDQAESSLIVIEILNPVVDGDDLIYSYNITDGAMPLGGGASALFIDRVGPGGGVGAGFHGVGVGARGPGVAGWAGVAARNCAEGGC